MEDARRVAATRTFGLVRRSSVRYFHDPLLLHARPFLAPRLQHVLAVCADILSVAGGMLFVVGTCLRRTLMTHIPKAGGAAGTAVDLLFFPIDTVKTRLQSSQGFLRAGGFKGVYKGIGSVVVGSAPGGTPCGSARKALCRLHFATQPRCSSALTTR